MIYDLSIERQIYLEKIYITGRTLQVQSWLENLWHVWDLNIQLLGFFFPVDQLFVKGLKGIIGPNFVQFKNFL